jgi:hypothetical protein
MTSPVYPETEGKFFLITKNPRKAVNLPGACSVKKHSSTQLPAGIYQQFKTVEAGIFSPVDKGLQPEWITQRRG